VPYQTGWDMILQHHMGLISQHAPSVHVAYTHLISEALVFLACESFGEDVGSLVISGDIFEVDGLSLILLTQEMMADLNVFDAVMEFGVVSDSNGGLVVNE
jgi:hypothetical protein